MRAGVQSGRRHSRPDGRAGLATYQEAGCGRPYSVPWTGVTNASLIAGLGGGGIAARRDPDRRRRPGRRILLDGRRRVRIVTNQDELVHAEVATERKMHANFPAAEQAELADTFIGYGADRKPRREWPPRSPGTPIPPCACIPARNSAVDPFELPSAVMAGVSSLVAFSAGALIPLLPYLAGLSVLSAALGLAAVALLTGGMVVGKLTGRPMLRSGLRQLALGGVAVAVTFTVGSLIGGGHVA